MLIETTLDNITALAGGGQTGATPLIAGLNRVTTVATSGDSLLAPKATKGSFFAVAVYNTTQPNLFPQAGEFLDVQYPATVNQPYSVFPYVFLSFFCATPGRWTVVR